MLAPMFAIDRNKTQEQRVLTAQVAAGPAATAFRCDAITMKWPILDASGPPPISLDQWKFSIGGMVASPREKLIEVAGGALADAHFVVARGYDAGFTTDLPLADFLAEDALVAFPHGGEPLTDDHGGAARLKHGDSWKEERFGC
jgi:DMSO/TMAO reductase YedYZ molybdopterin-dependent catalytic subunit